jgi:hypothetical protein
MIQTEDMEVTSRLFGLEIGKSLNRRLRQSPFHSRFVDSCSEDQ